MTESRELSIFNRISTDISKLGQEFQMLLPSHVSQDKFVKTVVTAIQKNPDLMDKDIDKSSLYMSCMESAQDGLIVDGKQAALVVFNCKVKRQGVDVWVKKVQYMPMIQGLRDLVERSGLIKSWDCYVVRENDEFDYALGDSPYIHHKPAKRNRGNFTHAYSIAVKRSGVLSREIMDIDELNDVRRRSKNGTKAVWNMNEAEMYRKTVAHRHFKTLPKSPEVDQYLQRWESGFDLDDDAPKTMRTINEEIEQTEYVDAIPDSCDEPINEQPMEGEIIVSDDNQLLSAIQGAKTVDDLNNLLQDLNKIKNFDEKKRLHKEWMNRKGELEKAA